MWRVGTQNLWLMKAYQKNILGSQIIITIIIVFYLTLIKIQINDKTKSYT